MFFFYYFNCVVQSKIINVFLNNFKTINEKLFKLNNLLNVIS